MPVALGTGVPFKSKFSGTVVDPGLALLQSATLWLNAAQSVAGEQSVVNQGTGGSALDARYGSTTGVDTNDPLLLTHTGTNYLYLPGTSGNNASTPDSAALDITGDIEMVFRCAPASWTVTQTLGGKWNSPSQKSYILYTEASTGKLLFWLSADGSTGIGAPSSTGVPFGAGTAGWVKVTYRFSDKRVQFFTAADQSTEPSSWTQLGTDVTHTIASATFSSTAPMWVGADTGTTNPFTGSIYRAIARNGIGGTVVFDANFTANTNQSSFTESSSNAATVTINRSTSGRKAVMVTRPVWLFGTDDYMEIADNALLDFAAGESFTICAVVRKWAIVGSYSMMLSKNTAGGTSAGYALLNDDSLAFNIISIADGTTQVYNTASRVARTLGVMHLASGVRDTTADTVNTWTGTTSGTASTDTTTASLANTAPLSIGRQSGGAPFYGDMEVLAVAVFRSALTSTQLGQIATYYGV